MTDASSAQDRLPPDRPSPERVPDVTELTRVVALDGPAGSECLGERWREFGFNTNDPDLPCIPGRNAPDQAATPNRHQKCREILHLIFEFEADCALSK